jgi:hypothetical protein
MLTVKGFIHCYATHNWRSVLEEQLAYVNSSGLGGRTKQITIVILSNSSQKIAVPNHYFNSLEIHVITPLDVDNGLHPYDLAESATLRLIHSAANQLESNEETLFWYIHGKGVTRYHDNSYPNAANFRRLCESVVIGQYGKCIHTLSSENIDVCGPLLNSTYAWPHFSGNFWWARGSYLRTLAHPFVYAGEFVYQEKLPIRWAAEAWLLSKRGRAKDLLHVPEALEYPWLYGHDLSDMLTKRGITPESALMYGFTEFRRKVIVLTSRIMSSLRCRLQEMINKHNGII